MSTMLKGKISISAPYGGGTDYIQIEIEDGSSHARFLCATMSYRDFTAAVVGRAGQPCEFELAAEQVGLIHQHKKEEVFVPDGEWATRKERAAEAVKALEIDGWVGRGDDALNQHRLAKRENQGAWYSVTFVRYIKPNNARKEATK